MSESSSENPLDVLAEEFVDRWRRGEKPALSEYTQRYPHLAERIRQLFPTLVVMEQVRPQSGDLTREPEDSTTEGHPQQLGEYRILREIGRGGMGIVYEAEQSSLGRHIALKVLPTHSRLQPERLRRFQREARAAAQLHHTNIVPVFGVGEHQGLHYYVMQFIPGLGLDQILTELCQLQHPQHSEHPPPSSPQIPSAEDVARSLLTGSFHPQGPVAEVEANPAASDAPVPLPGQTSGEERSSRGQAYWHSVARIGSQVANALHHAWEQGILHRDIKPSNLLLDARGNVWITDFGLAKAEDSDNLTQSGDIVGTMRYLAPERFQGQADIRSDIYSLGLTLYELLALRPAFEGQDRQQLIQQVMQAQPVHLQRLVPTLPRDLATIIHKALAFEPDERYQTAQQFAEDLDAFLEDRTIRARRASVSEQVVRWIRRNRMVASLGGAILALLLMITVGATLWALDAQQRADRENLATQEARTARQEEEKARRIVEAKEDEARRLLGKQYVRKGLELMDKGDLGGALLWFTAALENDPNDSERVARYRMRIGPILRQCPRPLELRISNGPLLFSPDDRLMTWVDEDPRTVRVVHAATGERSLPLIRTEKAVSALAFTPDGKSLVIQNGRPSQYRHVGSPLWIRVWDLSTGKPRTPLLRTHWSISGGTSEKEPFGDRYLFAGADPRMVQVWDLRTGKQVRVLKHNQPVIDIVSCPTPNQALGGRSGDTRVVLTISGHQEVDRWDRDLAGGRSQPREPNRTLCFWEIPSGRLLRDPQTGKSRQPYSSSCSLTLSPDGNRILVNSRDSLVLSGSRLPADVYLWNARTGELIQTYSGRPSDFSWDGKRFYLSRKDKMQLMDATTGEPLAPPEKHPARDRYSFLFRYRGFQRRSSSTDSWKGMRDEGDFSARLVDLPTGQPLGPILPQQGLRGGSGFGPEGTRVLLSEREGCRVWNPRTGEPLTPLLRVLPSSPENPRAFRVGYRGVGFSPAGRHVLTSGGPGLVRIWPLTGGAEGSVLLQTKGMIRQAYLSADGRRALIQTISPWGLEEEHPFELWDTTTGRPFPARLPPAQILQFSADGQRFLVVPRSVGKANKESTLQVWNARKGKLTTQIQLTAPCQHALLCANGKRVLSIGEGSVQIWDGSTGKPLTPLLKPKAPSSVQSQQEKTHVLAWFSPDSQRLFTMTAREPLDDTLRDSLRDGGRSRGKIVPVQGQLWDIARGQAMGQPLNWQVLFGWVQHRQGTNLWPAGQPFSPDGSKILTREARGVRLWSALTGEPLTPVLTLKPGVLSPRRLPMTPEGFSRLAHLWTLGAQPSATTSLRLAFHADRLSRTRVFRRQVGMNLDRFVYDAVFSPDSHRVLVYVQGHLSWNIPTARLWNTETGKPEGPAFTHQHQAWMAAFSPDGKRIMLASNESLEVLDSHTGKPVLPLIRSSGIVHRVGFSPDGRRIFTVRRSRSRFAVTGVGGHFRVWDAATGMPLLPAQRCFEFGLLPGLVREDWPDWLSRDGNTFLVQRGDGLGEVLDLSSVKAPIQELRSRAEWLSGRRIGPLGTFEPVERVKPDQDWHLGRAAPPPHTWHLQQARACLTHSPLSARYDPLAAVWHLNRVLRDRPQDQQAHGLRGQALLSLGRWKDALSDLERAGPTTAQQAWYRGLAHTHLGDWDQAAKAFEQATRDPLLSSDAWATVALVRLRQTGQEQKYQEACQRLLNVPRQRSRWGYGGLARRVPAEKVLTAGPLTEELAKSVRKLARSQREGLSRLLEQWHLGGVLYRAGKHEEASNWIQQALKRYPDQAQPIDHFFLALALHAQGNSREAARALAQGKKLHAEQSEVRRAKDPRETLPAWANRLVEQVLLQEAEQTLQKTKGPR